MLCRAASFKGSSPAFNRTDHNYVTEKLYGEEPRNGASVESLYVNPSVIFEGGVKLYTTEFPLHFVNFLCGQFPLCQCWHSRNWHVGLSVSIETNRQQQSVYNRLITVPSNNIIAVLAQSVKGEAKIEPKALTNWGSAITTNMSIASHLASHISKEATHACTTKLQPKHQNTAQTNV